MPLESRTPGIRRAAAWPQAGADEERRDLAEDLDNVMRFIQPPKSEPATAPLAGSDSSHLNAALEMVKRAAQAMDAMEDHAQVVQAKAQELAEQARYDVRSARHHIAALEQRLSESEARAEELEARLAEAQERAHAAHEWLERFQETINAAFAARHQSVPGEGKAPLRTAVA
jgi:chromosome segregation ATPase